MEQKNHSLQSKADFISQRSGTFAKARREHNALQHGMRAASAILPYESQEEWDKLHAFWCANYDDPPAGHLLSELIRSVVDAEWERRRVQREYQLNWASYEGRPMVDWTESDHKRFALFERYRTAADRKFHKEFRMLESYYKSMLARQERAEKRAQKALESAFDRETVEINDEVDQAVADEGMWVLNSETGERVNMITGVKEPPPADWKPYKITPGEYHPLDPSNIVETLRKQRHDKAA